MSDAKLKPPKALGKGALHLKTYERKANRLNVWCSVSHGGRASRKVRFVCVGVYC